MGRRTRTPSAVGTAVGSLLAQLLAFRPAQYILNRVTVSQILPRLYLSTVPDTII